MKLCICGGRWQRVGTNNTNQGGMRYRCAICGEFITVRDGSVVGDASRVAVVPWVSIGSPKRPEVRDWRHV